MYSSLTIAAALFAAGAPTAKEVALETGNQPPRFLEIQPDADGKIKVAVFKPGNGQGGGIGGLPKLPPNLSLPPNLKLPLGNLGGNLEQVELAKLKDLVIFTPSGKKVSIQAAQKALSKGGTVVVSTDGKKVSPTFLKLLKEDVLVLISPDLAMGGIQLPNIELPMP
ncbi:MAG: hypothetical protein K8T89_01020 [Planctomycetes bacterium]|nr:hypothetical protein [Planctomycetota bacterium]